MSQYHSFGPTYVFRPRLPSVPLTVGAAYRAISPSARLPSATLGRSLAVFKSWLLSAPVTIVSGKPLCAVKIPDHCQCAVTARSSFIPAPSPCTLGGSNTYASTNLCFRSYADGPRSRDWLNGSSEVEPANVLLNANTSDPSSISFEYVYAARTRSPFMNRRSTENCPAW